MGRSTAPLSFADPPQAHEQHPKGSSVRHDQRQKQAFTIGICATGIAENLPRLLELVSTESFYSNFSLERIIVVASRCSHEKLSLARSYAKGDSRVVLIVEPERQGKADAINKIVEQAIGTFLVFVNSDALPMQGSIAKLLRAITMSSKIGVVSGRPLFRLRGDITSTVEEFMWTVHNECSTKLNHMDVSNHGSDEMMVVRTELLGKLPDGLVNDGAYISGRARLNGYSIKFSQDAAVLIDVPARQIDLIRQRERIIFGHFQVWQLTGKSPKTIETLMLHSPVFSLAIVVRTIARNPKLIKAIPAALAGEAVSILLALRDTFSSTKKHRVWARYGN